MAKTAKSYKAFTIKHRVSNHERTVTVEQYEDIRKQSQNWMIIARHEDDITQKAETSRPLVTGKPVAKAVEKPDSAE
jgi:hypothetical protein